MRECHPHGLPPDTGQHNSKLATPGTCSARELTPKVVQELGSPLGVYDLDIIHIPVDSRPVRCLSTGKLASQPMD
jgi:hypothetical protein